MHIHILQSPNLTILPPNPLFPQLKFTHLSYPQVKSRYQVGGGECNLFKSMSKSRNNSGGCCGGGLLRVICGDILQPLVEDEEADRYYMSKCVELAKKAIGKTSPNPMVGCVIVKDGEIIGQGFHPKPGEPHAEVFALREAGSMAENATAYVSLEPCNHYGRTPPCTEALIKAKVKRVVVGMVDPNPIVSSQGVERLQEAGIDVRVMELQLCRTLNEAYIHKMLTGKPFVKLRYSISLNGQISEDLGKGSTDSGGYYSKLLQENDAIVHASTLVNGVSPVPHSREPGAKQPTSLTVLATPSSKSSSSARTSASEEKQTETSVAFKQLSWDSIIEHSQEACSVLLDFRGNGPDLQRFLKEGIEQNLVHKVIVEVLPFWDGGGSAPSILSLNDLGRSLQINNLQVKPSNGSIILEGYF